MTLTRPDWDALLLDLAAILAGAHLVGITGEPGAAARYRPRYNVAPTQPHPIVRSSDRQLRLGFAHWGLLARGDGKPAVINARAETAASGRAFRSAFAHRRCVVPADGFFEWRTGPSGREPLWFHRGDGKLLLLAGLFDEEPPVPTQAAQFRFGILTTPPNRLMAAVHNRMPALLSPNEAAAWLERPTADVLHPAAEDFLVATPVSSRVSSVKYDDPGCLAPPPRSAQTSLF